MTENNQFLEAWSPFWDFIEKNLWELSDNGVSDVFLMEMIIYKEKRLRLDFLYNNLLNCTVFDLDWSRYLIQSTLFPINSETLNTRIGYRIYKSYFWKTWSHVLWNILIVEICGTTCFRSAWFSKNAEKSGYFLWLSPHK